MSANPAPENSRFTAPGIVSVNDRGQAAGDLGKKVLFAAVAAALLLVGAAYSYNHWREQHREQQATSARVATVENKPAAVPNKHDFAAEAAAAKTAARSPFLAPTPSDDCKSIAVLDNGGQPILGKDGQPIRIGCDGRIVPAIDPAASPGGPVTPQPAATAGDGGVMGQTAAPLGSGQTAKVVSRYSGDVMLQAEIPVTAREDAGPSGPAPAATGGDATAPAGQGSGGGILQAALSQPPLPQQSQATGAVPSHQGNVGPLLTATVIPKITATKLEDRNLLLAKGAQIDCALTTKLVNEVSGFASCVLTSNIYSDNGRVLLLERGSEALGEYAAAIQQGQRRLFVLWQRVKTPAGIVINLDSPAADGLGTMGLGGYVDNRWWDRLGAAFLLSFIQDGIAYKVAEATNSSSSPAGGFAYQNTAQTGSQMADRVLASTINIRPTIYKNQGDRASIYVARDLDFSTVYALRAN